MSDPAESPLVEEIEAGKARSLYLVTGEAVLAERAGRRIADALAGRFDSEVTVTRRPAGLASVLADLRTYSLFGGAKVILVLESAVLSDRGAAAYLVDQAADVLPFAAGTTLSDRERAAGGRLLQVLRLFDVESSGRAASELLAALPRWVFEGGSAPGSRSRGRQRKRGKKQVESLVEGLVGLLDAALAEGLAGWAEDDASDLGALQKEGLPDGHFLVMCEAAAARDHPVVARLAEEGALVEVATVEADRRGRWQGAEELAREMVAETGCSITRDGLAELVRRTLRQRPGWGAGAKAAQADSTVRFSAEYRKLASLAEDGRIDRRLVAEVVQDRGEEDLWGVLDAIGAGRCEQALERYRRLIDGAEDETAARLGFFAQLAQFCRHLSVVSGLVELYGMPPHERAFQRFKSRYAPKLLESMPDTEINLLGSLHPFRLHKAYLAASRLDREQLAALHATVLETELRLKGESSHPDAALTRLISYLAA